jgi:1-deoxy-D-xylulose-5-phosphate reductoisomerase
MKKTVAVLGATGSVGEQALSVAEARGYRVDYMSAGKNAGRAEQLARRFCPTRIAMADEGAAKDLRARLADTDIQVLSGAEGILEGIERSAFDTAVNAILGQSGLAPSLAVLDKGKRLALANKESLVIGGSLVTERAAEKGAEILPVDSEHCAIFQCMKAGRAREVKRILLTASGGPFYGYTKDALRGVTLERALAHPTWKMGAKITVDSATLMNKGFELIEAVHLFGVAADAVKVVVHRESIIHSAVEYIDNTVIAEMSVPDMRACVQYAVDYPNREEAVCEPLDLFSVGTLSFLPPYEETFSLLPLARRAVTLGGGMGAVLNAADEVAVAAFLAGKLPFYRIAEVVCDTFSRLQSKTACRDLASLNEADAEARELASSLI